MQPNLEIRERVAREVMGWTIVVAALIGAVIGAKK